MKLLTTTLLTILLSVSLFAQETEPFTLEYTFEGNANAAALYERASNFIKSESHFFRYPSAIGTQGTLFCVIIAQSSIKSYRNRDYLVWIDVITDIKCEDQKYIVRIKDIGATISKGNIYYKIAKTIPCEFSEDERSNALLKDSKDFAINFIDNTFLPLLKEYMDNPIIQNWSFQEE